MKISNFAISRSVTTAMLILLIVIIGLVSFSNLKIDLYPDITFPGAAIVTTYEGVGSEEIENLITRPIESSISTVEGVKNISSISSMGQSTVVVEFNWGTDMDFAVQNLREQTDLVNSALLPDAADSPLIFKFDPAMLPIMIYGLSSDDLELYQLKKEVEDNIAPELERLPGVAQVNIQGGLEREIIISLKREKLNFYNLDLSTINNILINENLNTSAGEIKQGNKDLLVRAIGKFKSLEDIRNINIPIGESGKLKLSEIAAVDDSFADPVTISRSNQKDSVGLYIQKQTDANTVEVANRVRTKMEEIKEDYNSLNIFLGMDQSEFIQNSIDNVSQNAVLGGILAVIILFIFLRNIRSTIIIATAIPVSIIATFVLMYFADINLNIISLGGLALGVGMLVDNAIVVLENIYRYRSMGEGKIESAKEGSTEVAMAIVASTMTTVVVFMPVLFVEGLAARLFKDLAFTVAFSLLASLIVALTLIPMLASKILKLSQKEIERQKKEGRIISIYKALLTKALNHRWVVVIILVILLGGSIMLLPLIGFEFMPAADQGAFAISYTLPVGSSLEESNRAAVEIEEILSEIPEVDIMMTTVGTTDIMQGISSSNSGSINVDLVDLNERERSIDQIMEEIREKVKIPDLNLTVASQSGMGGQEKPINIKIKGNDFKILKEYSALVVEEIKDISGLREIEDSFEDGRPELQVKINREIASKFSINLNQLAASLKNAISGTVNTRYEVEGEEYNIRVRVDRNDYNTFNKLSNLNIVNNLGINVPLTRISDFELVEGPAEILRINQDRYAEITADLFNRDLGSVVNDIRSELADFELPEGYEISYEGQFEDLNESFTSLAYAFLLSIVLIYMVMASQFESLIHPFIIMFTIPLAVIGVILSLYISSNIISVASLIGLITLAGIVVNNAIVMVDYINQLRRQGTEKIEAIISSGVVRFRPIMMTALTTILALIPIASGIGEGSELSQPIGIVIVSGLSFATFLTLFIIPIFYSLITDLKEITVSKIRGIDRKEVSKMN
ncbi:MAG: efflux RND transporter permease subunit [Halanaerobium sp.]